ncbi:MAG: LacI family DNA-binding transcriptional regulator [Woeseiaceae bacterium]|nr:LacI family DNA-binding transcriptional regulator [Woeseiaceae bacterium]
MKVTLDDVAQKAGVSRATVDRVLNERGNVKQSTAERVYRAVFNTNYFIGPLAERDGNIIYKFDFVFPILKTGYFDSFTKEIEKSQLAFSRLNSRVQSHMVDGLEPEILAEKLIEVGTDTDGIAFVALDHPIVREAVDTLSKEGVGLVSLVSDLSRSSRLAYVGLDNRAAGRTAALLMGRFLSDKEAGSIALFPGRPSYRGHEEREAGFKSMIRERFPRFKVIDALSPHFDNDVSFEEACRMLDTKTDLVSIYNTAGATDGIAKALIERGKDGDVVFIAHELSELTRRYLINNTIDVIINQDIRHEVFSAIELLVRHKKRESVELSVRQPRVEIYLSENVY